MTRGILVAALACVLPPASAADQELWGLKVRRSAQVADDASKAAALGYTGPSGADSSYAVDMAVSKLLRATEKKTASYERVRSSELSAFVEWHKNTLGTKKQDTSFFGVNLETQYGSIPNYPIWVPRSSLALAQDKVKATKSALLQADLTSVDRRKALNAWRDLGDAVSLKWSPILGAEYQYAFDNDNGPENGHISRLYGSLDVGFAPAPWADRVTLLVGGKAWREAGRAGLYDDQSSRTKKLGSVALNLQVIPDKAVISLTRESGENPTEGLPKSSVTKLQFKLKFN